MRVLWIVYGALEQVSGGYIYDRLVVEYLRRVGVDLQVLSIEPGCHTQQLARRVERSGASAVVGDGLCIPELAPLFQACAGCCSRLLLVHHLTSWEAVGGHGPEGEPSICTPELRMMRSLEQRAFAHCDLVVTTSAPTLARLRRAHPGLPAQVVPPGADRLPLFPRRATESSPLRLLFVGHWSQRKGLLLLLDALESLASPRLTLLTLGDPAREGGQAALVASRVERSPYLRGCVTLGGLVDDAALARELAAADALVMPSILEGYGMVLTEALRAGLPVIATSTGVLAGDALGDCGALRVSEPGALGLASALAQWAGDHRLRQRLQDEVAWSALPTWHEAGAQFHAALLSLSCERAVLRA